MECTVPDKIVRTVMYDIFKIQKMCTVWSELAKFCQHGEAAFLCSSPPKTNGVGRHSFPTSRQHISCIEEEEEKAFTLSYTRCRIYFCPGSQA